MASVHDTRDNYRFGIHFDYICKNNPQFSNESDDKYINAYIVKLFYDDRNIVEVFDINDKNIDITPFSLKNGTM
jgi:hypothetical protein